MGVVEEDFDKRCGEVESYLEYLDDLEKSTGIDPGLMATMKASALLMIYNLVESTTSNAIESIFDHLRQANLGFASVDDSTKAMVLKCARETNPKDLVKRMRDEMLDLAVAAFKKDSIFSGNVDSKKIREVWKDYGVVMTGSYSESVLVEIKTARNELAHGAKSFAELGQHQSASELKKKYRATKSLLQRALGDVSSHINNNFATA